MQAYSFTALPIGNALARARARGVDVEVILDKSEASGAMARRLAGAGIPSS